MTKDLQKSKAPQTALSPRPERQTQALTICLGQGELINVTATSSESVTEHMCRCWSNGLSDCPVGLSVCSCHADRPQVYSATARSHHPFWRQYAARFSRRLRGAGQIPRGLFLDTGGGEPNSRIHKSEILNLSRPLLPNEVATRFSSVRCASIVILFPFNRSFIRIRMAANLELEPFFGEEFFGFCFMRFLFGFLVLD